MTASEGIKDLPAMLKKLNTRVYRLDKEIEQINEEWNALGSMGGQRDDHAANYLRRLRPHLEDISRFIATCHVQLEIVIADPFGRS